MWTLQQTFQSIIGSHISQIWLQIIDSVPNSTLWLLRFPEQAAVNVTCAHAHLHTSFQRMTIEPAAHVIRQFLQVGRFVRRRGFNVTAGTSKLDVIAYPFKMFFRPDSDQDSPEDKAAGADAAAKRKSNGDVLLSPLLPLEDHLWLKGKAQLAVDSLLMNTHSTGVDSWWAGVPVITLPGYKMPARVGASLAYGLGITDTIVRNLDDYKDIAVALALNKTKRDKLRARVLAAMDSQPLFDPKRFTSDWERSLKMWALYLFPRPALFVMVVVRLWDVVALSAQKSPLEHTFAGALHVAVC